MVTNAILVPDERAAYQPVANRPLLVHALETLAAAGIKRAAVAVAPGTRGTLEAVLEHASVDGPEITCAEHDPAAGLGATLGGLSDFVAGGPVVLHLGDSLGRDPLRPLFDAAPAEGDSTVLVQEGERDGEVVELASRRAGGTAAGVWVLGAGVPETLGRVPSLGSAELDLAGAMRRLTALGGRVTLRPVADWWRFRDAPGALLEANRFALGTLVARPIEARLAATEVQGPVVIHPTATLESCTVRGPAVIGAGTCLRETYIGPYTSIGDHVLVEGAEIENSILLERASVTYLGGRLEGSILGPGARIFRDFRLPRAMRVNVGAGAEISLA